MKKIISCIWPCILFYFSTKLKISGYIFPIVVFTFASAFYGGLFINPSDVLYTAPIYRHNPWIIFMLRFIGILVLIYLILFIINGNWISAVIVVVITLISGKLCFALTSNFFVFPVYLLFSAFNKSEK